MAENAVLPAGVYPARIAACELHDFKNGGQGYRIRFRFTAPEHKDKQITAYFAFEGHPTKTYLEKGLRQLQELWYACGNPGSWQDAPFAAATFEGQECAIKLTVEKDSRTPGATQNSFQGAWTLDGKKYVKPKDEPAKTEDNKFYLPDDVPF